VKLKSTSRHGKVLASITNSESNVIIIVNAFKIVKIDNVHNPTLMSSWKTFEWIWFGE